MLMKLKALRPNKTPALKTGCLSDNQNTPATWSKMLIKVVHFFGGGGVGQISTQPFVNSHFLKSEFSTIEL